MHRPAALLIARSYLDVLLDVAALPRVGERVPARQHAACGGAGVRCAFALAATTELTFVTALGADGTGQEFATRLAAAGVTLCASRTTVTPVSYILAGGIDRTIVSYRPEVPALTLPSTMVRPPAVICSDGNDVEVLCEARRRWPDALCSMDIGNQWRPGIDAALGHLDVVCGHAELLGELTGTATLAASLAALFAAGVRVVALTEGANGARLHTPTGSLVIPAPTVDAVDTAGCGDIFHITLATALVAGHPLPEAAHMAVARASAHAAVWGNALFEPAAGGTRPT